MKIKSRTKASMTTPISHASSSGFLAKYAISTTTLKVLSSCICTDFGANELYQRLK